MSALFSIGRFRLDVRARALFHRGAIVPLGPKVIDTLIVLVRRHGELVTKAELMDAVWPNDFVEEANLTQNVYRLRRTLESGGVRNAIRTLPGRGYCFTAGVGSAERLGATARRSPFLVVGLGIAATIALALSLAPAASQLERLSAPSRQAYRLGVYHLSLRWDAPHAWQALHYFNEVASRDPRSPLGYAGMADAYLAVFDAQCESSTRRCGNIQRLAVANAQRAVRLDAGSAEAHTALAMAINEFYSDDSAAEREFRTAMALDASYALAHHWYGNLLTVEGRYDEAAREQRAALRLDPTSQLTYAWLAQDAFLSRRYDDAISYAREAASLSPLHHPTLVMLGLAYERTGRLGEAQACFNRLPPLESRAMTAAMFARHGRRDRAVAMLRGLDLAHAAAAGATAATAFAWIAIGDESRAYAYIHSTPLPNRIARNFLARDPRWDWDRAGRSHRWITAV